MKFDHIVLNVHSMSEMVEFYRDVLMCTVERLDEYKAGNALFPIVRLSDENIIDLFPKEMWSEGDITTQGNNMNHYCLVMLRDQWDELQQRLSDNKVQIDEGPVRRGGAQGMGNSIYFRDPDGNSIEARYYDRDTK